MKSFPPLVDKLLIVDGWLGREAHSHLEKFMLVNWPFLGWCFHTHAQDSSIN